MLKKNQETDTAFLLPLTHFKLLIFFCYFRIFNLLMFTVNLYLVSCMIFIHIFI